MFLFIVTIALIFALYYYYFEYINKFEMDSLINEYYQINNKKFEDIIIRKLSFKEKLRHALYLSSSFWLKNNMLFFLNRKGKRFVRAIEITDLSDNEFVTFIEFFVKRKKIIELNEIITYDYQSNS